MIKSWGMEREEAKSKGSKVGSRLPKAEGEKLAVLELGGRPHLVREGSELEVSHLALKESQRVKVPALILKPILGEGTVTYRWLGEKRGPKVLVMKYKAKSRYRRKRGYRAELSKVIVEKIETGK